MKKGWKRFWIICASILGAGIILCLVAVAGLGFTWAGFRSAYPNGISLLGGNHHFGILNWVDDWDEDWDTSWSSDYDATPDTGGTESGTFTREFPWTPNLDLELSGGDLIVQSYEGDKIKVDCEDINKELEFRCYIDEDELCIRTSKKVWKQDGLKGKKAGTVTMSIPKDMLMDEINIAVGAGSLNVDELLGESVELDVGAGEAVLSKILAYDLDIKGGTGNVTAGCTAMGDIDVKCGVGNVDLIIEGSENAFNHSVMCGIGSVRIGDREFSGLARKVTENRNGIWDLDIKCGIGNVNIDFVE